MMKKLTEQLAPLRIARYEFRLWAWDDAVFGALIGSALRGAFGHSLKAVACSARHGDCENCLLASACAYKQIFEPVSEETHDIPRPFIFEPPTPPLTREVSESQTLKLSVKADGLIPFGLTIIGDAIERLPYFISAVKRLAHLGLGAERYKFLLQDAWVKDARGDRYLIYENGESRIEPHGEFIYTLKELTQKRLHELQTGAKISLRLSTPLRIRKRSRLLTKPDFADLFKYSSLRLKAISENYAQPLQYDYLSLIKNSKAVKASKSKLWLHSASRWTNRRKRKLALDGVLGEMVFESGLDKDFLPFLAAGELLHIGSSSSFGFGRYHLNQSEAFT